MCSASTECSALSEGTSPATVIASRLSTCRPNPATSIEPPTASAGTSRTPMPAGGAAFLPLPLPRVSLCSRSGCRRDASALGWVRCPR